MYVASLQHKQKKRPVSKTSTKKSRLNAKKKKRRKPSKQGGKKRTKRKKEKAGKPRESDAKDESKDEGEEEVEEEDQIKEGDEGENEGGLEEEKLSEVNSLFRTAIIRKDQWTDEPLDSPLLQCHEVSNLGYLVPAF